MQHLYGQWRQSLHHLRSLLPHEVPPHLEQKNGPLPQLQTQHPAESTSHRLPGLQPETARAEFRGDLEEIGGRED